MRRAISWRDRERRVASETLSATREFDRERMFEENESVPATRKPAIFAIVGESSRSSNHEIDHEEVREAAKTVRGPCSYGHSAITGFAKSRSEQLCTRELN
jgi:hypothetical protein